MSGRVLFSTLAFGQSRLRRPDIFPVLFSTLAFGQSRLRRPDIFPVLFSTLAYSQSRLRRPDIFPVLGHKAFPEFIPQAEFISAEENPVFLRPDKVQGFPQK